MCGFDHNDINSPVFFNHHLILIIHNFIFGLGLGLDLKKLDSASALTSKLWPRSRPQDPGLGLGLGLEILALFNITGVKGPI